MIAGFLVAINRVSWCIWRVALSIARYVCGLPGDGFPGQGHHFRWCAEANLQAPEMAGFRWLPRKAWGWVFIWCNKCQRFILLDGWWHFCAKQLCFRYYGTFSYTILTMFDAWQLPLTRWHGDRPADGFPPNVGAVSLEIFWLNWGGANSLQFSQFVALTFTPISSCFSLFQTYYSRANFK